MLTELCVAVSSYASSGRWEHQQLSSGTGITRSWECGNVAEMARTCLNVRVVRVVDSFRKKCLPVRGKGRRRYRALCLNLIGSMAERQSPVVDVLSTYNIANMVYTKVEW